jgi:hypothetical protein
MTGGNLQVRFSSRAFLGFVNAQKLPQRKLIPAVAAGEFYRIHAMMDKMKTQASGLYVLEGTAAHLLRIHGYTMIFQYDFKSITGLAVRRRMNPAEGCLDGLVRVAKVGMANNVGQRLINGKNHFTAFCLGESLHCRKLAQCVSHNAEHLRIAAQFHFE